VPATTYYVEREQKKKMKKVKLKVSKMLSAGRSKSISSRGRGGKSSSRTRLSPAERLKVTQLLRDNKISIADACQQYDIGVSTANKYLHQLKAEGAASFHAEDNRKSVYPVENPLMDTALVRFCRLARSKKYVLVCTATCYLTVLNTPAPIF